MQFELKLAAAFSSAAFRLQLQSLSRVRFFAIPWTAAHQASLSITISWSLLKIMSIELVMPSNHLILCRPLLLPSIFPSIRVFSSEPILHIFGGQSTGVSASASLLPMHIQDWFPLGWTGWISMQSKRLSRVFSNHSSKASILQCSAFFVVQLSHPYMTTGKTIALIIFFAAKVVEPLYSQQKQGWELTVAQIMNSSLPNSDLNWRN